MLPPGAVVLRGTRLDMSQLRVTVAMRTQLRASDMENFYTLLARHPPFDGIDPEEVRAALDGGPGARVRAPAIRRWSRTETRPLGCG